MGQLWKYSGISGWKLKGVLGALVHLNAPEQALGGLCRTPLPGELRWTGRRAGKLLTSLWKVSQKQNVSPDCFWFDQVAFSDKNLFFLWRQWHLGSLSPVNGGGGFELEPITVVSERWYLCLGINPRILKAGKWYLATLWGYAED